MPDIDELSLNDPIVWLVCVMLDENMRIIRFKDGSTTYIIYDEEMEELGRIDYV